MIAAEGRKILTKIYKRKKINERWKRTNQELRELYQESKIIRVIKVQRIRRMEHVRRMQIEKTPRRVMERGFGGRRRKRPRARCRNYVHGDLEDLGIP